MLVHNDLDAGNVDATLGVSCLADLILTAVLLDMKAMHKARVLCNSKLIFFEKQSVFAGLGSPCLSHEAGEVWLNIFH